MSSASSFSKILSILDLFSLQRSVISVDVICEELNVSKPMGYRYLKELVDAGFLKKATNNVGDYALGSKVAILDYISRTTDHLIQISIPYIREVVQRTEMICLLTALEGRHCIDIYHEKFIEENIVYGRGCPRVLSSGSSAKIILAHLPKKQLVNYYHYLADDLAKNGYASTETEFLHLMRTVKKQGYYVSKGELHPDFSSLSVPLKYSHKEAPWALTIIASTNRFEFLNIEKMADVLKHATQAIEQQLHLQSTLS